MGEEAQDVPLITGATYRTTGNNGLTVEGQIVAAQVRADGVREGELRLYGHKPEHVVHGSMRMNSLELVGRPASPRIGRPRKDG